MAIAVVTLGLYVGVPHILLGLLAFSWWRPAAITLALLLFTLLLPAKPLRVPSVLNSYVFLCWRRYFKFSYLFEQSLDCYQVRSSSSSSSNFNLILACVCRPAFHTRHIDIMNAAAGAVLKQHCQLAGLADKLMLF
jgi:hypothetical protein